MSAAHLAGPVPSERSRRSVGGRTDHGYVSDVRLPVVLAVGVLILVVAVVAIRLAYGSASNETRPRALVLGDSITDHGQRALRDTIGPLYLLSIEGQDNFRVDDQLPVAQRWATRDFSQVVINLGTNDVVQGWPIDHTTAGLEQIVSLFPEANCIHLTTVSESLPSRTNTTVDDAAAFNEAIRAMAETNPQVRIVDWNAIVDDQQSQGVDLTSDGVHPTTEGQQLLVDAYEASMTACRDD